MRNDLNNAFQEAKVVTARVRWLKTLSEDGEGTEGSIRWIHCTPLMHHTVSQNFVFELYARVFFGANFFCLGCCWTLDDRRRHAD